MAKQRAVRAVAKHKKSSVEKRVARMKAEGELLSSFMENAAKFPLSRRDLIEHDGEYFARSIDGRKVLGFGATLEKLKKNIQRDYGITLDDVSVGVVGTDV